MASTLVTRLCDPSQLSKKDLTSVMAELGVEEDALKLGLHAVVGAISELDKGDTLPSELKKGLTQAEIVDLDILVIDTKGKSEELLRLWLLLLRGESGDVTIPEIETILGL